MRWGSDTTRGAGCLILFALPFALVGVGTGYAAIRTLLGGDVQTGLFLLLFAVVFGGVGFGLIIGAIYGARAEQQAAARRTAHPTEPWLWKPDWAAGRVRCDSKGRMFGLWVFALFWNAISAPAAVMVPRELATGNHAALLALLFPLVGLGLLIAALRATLHWRRFGASVFELASVPGVVGGTLGGVIHVSRTVRPSDGYTLTLTCVNRVETGSGEDASTSDHVRWQEQRTVAQDLLSADPTRTAVPVLFTIPYDCAESDESDSKDRIIWTLKIEATLPGVDFDASFDVPVFRTEASSPEITEAEAARDDGVFSTPEPDTPSRITVTPLPGGVELYFPAARNPGVAVGITVFAAIWSGLIAFMVWAGAPILFPIMFGLFELLFICVMLWSWFGTTRVRVDRDTIAIAQRIAGLGTVKQLAVQDIDKIRIAVGMQAGKTPYYDITIWRRDETSVTAGGGIKSKREAEHVAATLRKALGIA